MSSYSIAQAKDNLSRLVDEVLDGKDVTITRHGKPVAELRPATLVGKPMSKESIERLRKHRDTTPAYDGDTIADIHAMRDDF